MDDLDRTINRLMDEQGWDTNSLIDLLVRFLETVEGLPQLAIAFLVAEAEAERGLAGRRIVAGATTAGATTDDEPILRVARLEFGRAVAESITVGDIDGDFERFPEFVAGVVEALLREGEYDDSDGADLVRFSTDRPAAVRRQWEALKARHPDLWAEE